MPYGKGASRIWAIATAQCEKMGKNSFHKGSGGDACRKRLAEGIAKHPPKARKRG